MDKQKGFSLIEVLVSFLLTTTVVFFLLELYGISGVFFQKNLQTVQLDSLEESLILSEQAHTLINSNNNVHHVQNVKLTTITHFYSKI